MADNTDYSEKTQEELRKILDERALPVSGTKQEQIDRLEADDKEKATDGGTANPEAQTPKQIGESGGGLPAQDGSTTPEIGGEPVENAQNPGTNTADIGDGVDANNREARTGEQVGETGPELGGAQRIAFEQAKAEHEERDAQVEYEQATYVDDDASHLLREIAEELGLTRPEDYAELSRLNGVDLNARIDKGEEVRLPKNYSYVDEDGDRYAKVQGGELKE